MDKNNGRTNPKARFYSYLDKVKSREQKILISHFKRYRDMKKNTRHTSRMPYMIAVTILAISILATSCSHRGVHMSKHRKSRHCNCPTFGEMVPQHPDTMSTINITYVID